MFRAQAFEHWEQLLHSSQTDVLCWWTWLWDLSFPIGPHAVEELPNWKLILYRWVKTSIWNFTHEKTENNLQWHKRSWPILLHIRLCWMLCKRDFINTRLFYPQSLVSIVIFHFQAKGTKTHGQSYSMAHTKKESDTIFGQVHLTLTVEPVSCTIWDHQQTRCHKTTEQMVTTLFR